jgi:hypothetical protein
MEYFPDCQGIRKALATTWPRRGGTMYPITWLSLDPNVVRMSDTNDPRLLIPHAPKEIMHSTSCIRYSKMPLYALCEVGLPQRRLWRWSQIITTSADEVSVGCDGVCLLFMASTSAYRSFHSHRPSCLVGLSVSSASCDALYFAAQGQIQNAVQVRSVILGDRTKVISRNELKANPTFLF